MRDLEIFRSSPGEPGLFEILDRTSTTGGRAACRRRFREPLSSTEAINAVQDAVRWIIDHRDEFRGLPGDAAVDPVTRYLRSNFSSGVSRNRFVGLLQSLWISVRYADELDQVRRGLVATRLLLSYLQQIAARLEHADPPGALRPPILQLQRAIGDDCVRRLCGSHLDKSGAHALLRWDTRVREQVRPFIDTALEALFEIDALVSMADATDDRGFAIPQFNADPSHVVGRGIYHPFLEAPVANDLECDDDSHVHFLTGPNMAGKTTYLKACGVAVFLAHIGMGVPARELRLPVFDCLYSGIHTTDNLREGKSYFLAEAHRVRGIAEHLRDGLRSFVLFDEMFKGTNVTDATEACEIVIGGFAHRGESVFLISSHLVELVEQLRPIPGIAFRYFSAYDDNSDLSYDYRIRSGSSAQRLGLRVLEEEGVFELLGVHAENGARHPRDSAVTD